MLNEGIILIKGENMGNNMAKNITISTKEYQKLCEKHTPKPPYIKNILLAFLFGGGICVFGELLNFLYIDVLALQSDMGALLVSVTLICIASFLTGAGVYDKLSHYAAAGTMVPITGFANAVASAALEFKTEGYIFGTASKIFSVAGPVIVFGTASSVVLGVLYWITKIFINAM